MENQALSGGLSTNLRFGLNLKNILRVFLLSIWATGTVYIKFDKKPFSECS